MTVQGRYSIILIKNYGIEINDINYYKRCENINYSYFLVLTNRVFSKRKLISKLLFVKLFRNFHLSYQKIYVFCYCL